MYQIYILIINVLTFLLFGLDKYKAKRGLWRIPEKVLFLFAILGGSIGGIVGMYLLRHKTRHKAFTIGLPAILVIQIILEQVLR